ncbi:MAG: hypothetical protein KGH78_04635, partial [Candidatus Micrarchaeota archaeon]|nr:hypothetical protein [Candidatus Micrarchaeota archaeon]
MGGFDQGAFDNFAIENGAIEFREEPIRLNSGRLSHIYMNWRSPLEDAYLKSELVSRYIIPFINDNGIKARTFYGVPEGATKLGLFVQDEWAKSQKDYQKGAYPLSMGRGRIKEHGAQKDKYFLGSPDGPTVIIEDVTTTGLSVI